jgi:hypothetical protein
MERLQKLIQRRKREMSLVGKDTQDRSIKREDMMERGKSGKNGEISTLVSGRVIVKLMVRSITCKMTAHTVSESGQVSKEEILAVGTLTFEFNIFSKYV